MPERAGGLEPTALERVASDTARAAAGLIAAAAGRGGVGARGSSPIDLATRTDRGAGDLIRLRLAEATPLADEHRAHSLASLQWVIDLMTASGDVLPDGPFAVSIAAAVDGEIVAGAVVDVLRGERFSAHLGGGARRDGEPIGISACDELADAVVATGVSPGPAPRAREDEIASRVGSRARELRRVASSALGLCWVGCGRLDGCFERGLEVGAYAAGALIAEEAGAVAELPCPENDDLVIAATPGIFEALRAVVREPVEA